MRSGVERTLEANEVSELISVRLYRILIDRVIHGVLAPGARIDVGAVASEFGVSRAPVRDALARMEHEQLVETRPRYGTFVVRPTEQDIHEICALRKGVEWVATGLAVKTLSEEVLRGLRHEVEAALVAANEGDYEPFFASDHNLHTTIVTSTGNSRLIRTRMTVDPWIKWMRVLGAIGGHRIAGSTQRHLDIIDSLLRGDADAARAAAALHLDEVEAWAIIDFPEELRTGADRDTHRPS